VYKLFTGLSPPGELYEFEPHLFGCPILARRGGEGGLSFLSAAKIARLSFESFGRSATELMPDELAAFHFGG